MLSARLRMSGEGAHAILEETDEKREKRRREYPTTDDIIGELLCLFRVILAAKLLSLFLSLSFFLSFSLFLYLFHRESDFFTASVR